MDCPFCDIEPGRIISESEKWYVIRDNYPVNRGHTLIILKRHQASFFRTTEAEWDDLGDVLYGVQTQLRKEFGCTDFNVGVNVGAAAGQTVPHVHVHVIPRFEGDCENPRGGVRKVKPPLVDY